MQLIAQQIGENLFYYLHNAHGDVVQRIAENGTSAPQYRYDAFGNEKDPKDTDPNPFRYCGDYCKQKPYRFDTAFICFLLQLFFAISLFSALDVTAPPSRPMGCNDTANILIIGNSRYPLPFSIDILLYP